MTERLPSVLRRYTALRFDHRAAAFLTLFAVVIGGALLLRPMLVSSGAVKSAVGGSTAGEQAGIGVVWAVAEAIFAGLLLGTLLLWRRFPPWLKKIARDALTIFIWMVVGAWALANQQFHLVLPGVLGLFMLAKVADEFDVWWAVNNVLAIAIAIYAAAAVGVILGPIIIGVGLVGLSVYDHVFANKQTWMFDIAKWTIHRKLPMLIIFPPTIRQPWDELAEDVEEDHDDIFGIGMADLLLPAAFVVALAQSGQISPMAGAVVGTMIACLRLSWRIEHIGGGAGLPPLTIGALGGAVLAMGVA